MTSLAASPFLRRILLADATVTAVSGMLLIATAELAAPLLGFPSGLLFEVGLSFLPFAALVAYLATRPRMTRPFVWAVIAYNAMWALDSIGLLFTGWVAPTGLGIAFVVAQAVLVLGFAELEYVGLRRAQATFA